MQLSGLNVLMLCIVGEFVGLNIFLKGFFPVKKAIEGYASFQQLPKEPWEGGSLSETSTFQDVSPVNPVFGHLVVILIDALRADFVYGERNKLDMPFTRALIDRGSTRPFLARAHPPTVTMPRIKALVSGTIPGFIDLVLNFDSAALSEDNLISQMNRQGKRLFFYGDDTWIRLFPGHFADTDGTTSFFVTDYTEVDNNVTRHVKPALANDQWDALILHYLGLDHIGHLGGPTSPLVSPKLLEMDDVIQTIYKALVEQDKSSALPSLMVLCGDHGMSDAGSHGGASASETLTPVVFMSSAFSEVKGAPVPHPMEVQQIDLAPTLALLMGFPIPQNSLGVAIPTMLEDSLSARQQLRALQLNNHQLSQVLAQNVDSFEFDEGYSAYQHALRLHAAWLSNTANGSTIDDRSLGTRTATQYAKAMASMRNRVSSSLARYDLHAMGCGLILMWLVLFIVSVITISLCIQSQVISDVSVSSSLVIGCCLATGIVHLTLCTAAGGGASELLCAATGGARAWSALFIAVNGLLGAVLLSNVTGLCRIGKLIQSYSSSWFEVSLLVGTIAHSLSLASSSFVEEEHQTWYFLTITLILVLSVHTAIAVISRPSDKMATHTAMATAGSLVVCRLLRAWNQTGIKWADRPDIGDWLVRPENKLSLSFMTTASFTVIYITRCHPKQNYRLAICLVGSYLYRYATGVVSLPVLLPASHKGIYEAWIVYVMVFVSLVKSAVNYARCVYKARDRTEKEMTQDKPINLQNDAMTEIAKELCDIHIMMVVLLLRPHNSAVTAMSVVLQHCIVGLALPWLQPRLWAVTLLHVWMGQVAFFAQGNSNSIATVDISAGYVGMNSYVHTVAGVLTAISTYAGPTLWILRLLVYVSKHYFNRYQSAALEVGLTLALSRALPLALYTTLVSLQRYHLFVWSVFSPKLLYQTMDMYITSASIVLILVHCGIGKGLKFHPS